MKLHLQTLSHQSRDYAFARGQCGGIGMKIVKANVAKDSKLFTDEIRLYGEASGHFIKHSAGDYASREVHNDTIKSYLSIFKRGMRVVYHHCAEKHLLRYLAEFDVRNNYRSNLGFSNK